MTCYLQTIFICDKPHMKEVQNIRILCAEVVERAGSGHPGAPLGLSHFMHLLYTEYLVLDPGNPGNPCRDIIVLSNGHACTIQYVMNHLVGFLSLGDLKSYRMLNSNTPGHPEKNKLGIEISTGPLGQGVASSVGFSISSSLSGSNHVYCVFGDGCYQEGISQEAFSLCSKLALRNITFIYDSNNTTIDGPTDLSMCENVSERFRSLDFTVLEADGCDSAQIRRALDHRSPRPKVVILRTRIGMDTDLEGSCKSHGAPLGRENVERLKKRYGFPEEEFYVSEELKETYSRARARMLDVVSKRAGRAPPDCAPVISFAEPYRPEKAATRTHLANALNGLRTSQRILTGCADLTPSVLSRITDAVDFHGSADFREGQSVYLRFGIREHAMCGVMNGIAAHGLFVPICGTFLNFITYGYPSVRIAALDSLKVVYILTHDSIQLGGDGPTHQPIEVLATMRATPNLVVLRPCDGREVRGALVVALRERGPAALILSRQPVSEAEYAAADCTDGVERGAYFLASEKNHDIILLATGSEVELAFKVKKHMRDRRISIVSFISFELFERQSEAYKREILDERAVKVSIEALATFGWAKYADLSIGLDQFGRSAPGKDVYEYFGFTPERVAERIADFVDRRAK